jgi:dTDP-4-dehydrorhamnose reductase
MIKTHLILGNGNLGHDICEKLKENPENEIILLSRSTNWIFPEDLWFLKQLCNCAPNYVWHCLGSGSIDEAKKNPEMTRAINVKLPELLMTLFFDSRIILFSSDYADSRFGPIKSFYAKTKYEMEQLSWSSSHNNGNIRVIRVSSLYGVHNPDNCFPGRLKSHCKDKEFVSLPGNITTPTPTDWLADIILKNIDGIFSTKEVIHYCAPCNPISIMDWGRLVLGEKKYSYLPFDEERPLFSNLGCSFAEIKDTCAELIKK